MSAESAPIESIEISPNFRARLEERITRLEQDAAWDERMLEALIHPDHIRRHRKLVAAQRSEALRMRLFLDRSRVRLPRPLIAL
jgi:uncharacterized coiled-coil protein SlyX